MAANVPIDKEREGFLKSPDIDIPLSIPVIAGKNMENAIQNEKGIISAVEGSKWLGIGPLPQKIADIEVNKLIKINNWVFNAKSVEIYEIITSVVNVPAFKAQNGISGKNSCNDNEKPLTHNAMEQS